MISPNSNHFSHFNSSSSLSSRGFLSVLVALFCLISFSSLKLWGVMPEKDLEQTVRMFNFDVSLINDSIDQEFLYMEQKRLEFWEDMDLIMENLEKVSLGLFSLEQK